MDDREYRDIALLNYIRALLDVPQDFPKEEIVRMYLEGKIGARFVLDDVQSRFDRIMREILSDKLQDRT